MRILITGSAGFIGFHLAKTLLKNNHDVHGYDGMTNYYDVNLKYERNKILEKYEKFSYTVSMLEDKDKLTKTCRKFKPNMIVHLAAQAGVRYSLENPSSYINSNILGTFNVMEMAKELKVKHFLIASTSSVYGENKIMPFNENFKTDSPLTIYAATKKANEVMAYSYAHLWNIPTTIFRFFTVYGPWGRPDMALFKFTKAILNKEPIDVYNYGDMYRDFTYVEDLANAIMLLMNNIPHKSSDDKSEIVQNAPYRIVNIGNSDKVKLLDFIKAIEKELGVTAQKNMLPMQTGDVPSTYAQTDLLKKLTGFKPKTNYKQGIKNFIRWYLKYYEAST